MTIKPSELLPADELQALRAKSDVAGALLVLHAWALILGSMALFVWWPNPFTFLLAVMVMAVAPLAFIAAINPSLNTATVTAIIVLLLPTASHGSPLDSAIDRVLEVAVGAITGLAVSFLVLPSRAHSQIRTRGAHLLELLASALTETIATGRRN